MEIKPYSKNAKKHPDSQLKQIAKSIKEFKCKNCGKLWTDYISNDKNKQFCSVKCKSDYSRVERVCKNCGKVFTICKSILKTNASGNYCCRKCYIEKMTTGLTRNKGGFRFLKDKLFPKPRFCAICGTSKRIHIHHILPYRYSEDNRKVNLIPLCISHHKKVEIETEKLLEIDSDKNRIFEMMSNILRSRQVETFTFLQQCKLSMLK